MGKGGNVPKRAAKKHNYTDADYARNKALKQERHLKHIEKIKEKSAKRKEKKQQILLKKLGD